MTEELQQQASPGGQLSVVIPAYNERARIGPHLEAILAYAEARSLDLELIVVDDGSEDGTAERVERAAAADRRIRLLRLERNGGKGRAVREGLLAARGEIRGFTDADGASPIGELDRVLPAFDAGAQVVIGSRALKAAGVDLDAQLHRVLIGRAFHRLLRLVVGLEDQNGRPLADSQCGFKWFTAAACEAIFRRTRLDGFAFDVEVLYLANRLGLPVAEVPVNWTERGDSSVDLWLDPGRMLLDVLRTRLRHRGVKAGAEPR